MNHATLPEWMKDVTLAELPAQHQALAETIGLEGLVNLIAAHGGETLYIPKADAIIRIIRDKRIRASYNGINAQALAREYGLSERQIYTIVEGARIVLPGQCSLFERADEPKL